MGGGSAQVTPHRLVSPLEALTEALGDGVEIVHARGCEASLTPTVVGGAVLRAPDGFEVERFAGTDLAGEIVDRQHLDDAAVPGVQPRRRRVGRLVGPGARD